MNLSSFFSSPKKSSLLARKTITLLVITFLLGGCIPQKETTYLQDLSQRDDYQNPYQKLTSITERYILQPNDQLYIQVQTANPKLSEFFNPTSTGNMGTQQNQALYTYPINDQMEIDFPFVGKVNLEGCTLEQAKNKMAEALKPFLSDSFLKMRLASNTFTILGEVNNPGRISMDKEQVTIYEAIALAGDIEPFGKKKAIKVIRPSENGSTTFFVDLTDQNLLDSDKYYIYPNDLIYVRPMKAKNWGIGQSFSFGIFSSALALYLSVRALTN
jgi:polysaccharide export outer membrane protein